MARSHIVQIADNFWNIRGSFRIGYLIDVGTHASLVRLGSGRFVMLDAYTLPAEAKAAVDALTDDGAALEAIINLHPFHTVHVEGIHRLYPHAALYGTQRHHRLFPGLPWQPLCSDDPALHRQFADALSFSVPRGVDFISANDNVHFASVLAFHRASRTVHVDDTFMYLQLPYAVNWLGLPGYVGLHPTLAFALEKRAGAAAELRQWVRELAADWAGAETLCAAHNGILQCRRQQGAPLGERMLKALGHVERILAAHENRYG